MNDTTARATDDALAASTALAVPTAPAPLDQRQAVEELAPA